MPWANNSRTWSSAAWKHLVVLLVIAFDDLKSPQTRQHVAADQCVVQVIGNGRLSSGAELAHRFLQDQVGHPRHPVELVKVTAGALDDLESFRQFPERLNRGVIQPRYAGFGHRPVRMFCAAKGARQVSHNGTVRERPTISAPPQFARFSRDSATDQALPTARAGL